MPVILGPKGKIARQVAYEREEHFERDVVLLSDHLFGPSVYVDACSLIPQTCRGS